MLQENETFINMKLQEAKEFEEAQFIGGNDAEYYVEALNADPDLNPDMDGAEDDESMQSITISEDLAFKWSHAAILLLLHEYQKRQNDFGSGKMSQKQLWLDISTVLKSHGHNITGPQCLSKFSGMKKTYKKTKDHNNKPGNSAKHWPYFSLMDDLMEDKPFIIPAAVCSSTGKKRTVSESSSSDDSDENTFANPFKWPHEAILLLLHEYEKRQIDFGSGIKSQKKLWLNISTVLKSHGHNITGPQCLSKFSGMKKTYKKMKDYNNQSGNSTKHWPYFSLMDDLMEDKSFIIPAAVCSSTGKKRTVSESSSSDENNVENPFKWPHEAILLLLHEYEKRQIDFGSGIKSQKKLWLDISTVLKSHGHNITGPQCRSKFSGMKKTYKKMKDHNNQSDNSTKHWPYFSLMDDLMEDKPFITPVAICSSTGKKRTVSESSEESSDGNNFENPFKWPHEAILLLLHEYEKRQIDFSSGIKSQKKLWLDISTVLKSHGHNITGPQCLSKFSGMKKTYKKTKDYNNKPGNSAKHWPYFSLMDDLMGGKPFTTPVTVSSSTRKKRTVSESSSSDGNNFANQKKLKTTPVRQLIAALEERSKISEENKERRFKEFMAFKAQKAEETLQVKKKALELLEKFLNSNNIS